MAPPPTLRLIEFQPQSISSIALIGNYPPRRCGIATFTADVREALLGARPDLTCDVYAMVDDGNAYAFPGEVCFEIGQQRPDDYRAAAARLARTQPDVICVEHEFGIFGGPAGEYLMLMLDAVDQPVVTTLHTVLEQPTADQKRVFSRLLARSSRLVVMAERGRRILREVWDVADDKIVVIAHGAPDRALLDPEPFKGALGVAGHEVLLTFGLLSPNKGIETVIRALPAIIRERPTALYLVLGATHPHVFAQEGGRYRESLQALADSLGVGDRLRLVDAYTDTSQLLNYLHAADIYVTPYLNVAQITSGTLSYAAALGKPIVSTPYWHAEELLSDGLGRLAPFGDSEAFSAEIIALLDNPEARRALGTRIYDASRHTVWSGYAERKLEVVETARALRRPSVGSPRGPAPCSPSLEALSRLTDSCGIIQHSLFDIPDRRHGYCLDDNARALILMHRLPGGLGPERRSLATLYAAFVQDAWNPDKGRFRNFMSYERRWLETYGSEDSNGRAAMSIAASMVESQDPAHRLWARSLMAETLPHLDSIVAPRANAFILLGLVGLLPLGWESGRVTSMVAAKLKRLCDLLTARASQGLPWFEGTLSYDNARLAEAVIRAASALGDPRALALGLKALDWLCRRQTGLGGHFLPVATADFGLPLDSASLFDQQPLEAAATIDACETAFVVTGDSRWIAEAERAYGWYHGANSLGVAVATPDGECYDGLTWNGINHNKGAESVVSFQLATCAIARLRQTLSETSKTAVDL